MCRSGKLNDVQKSLQFRLILPRTPHTRTVSINYDNSCASLTPGRRSIVYIVSKPLMIFTMVATPFILVFLHQTLWKIDDILTETPDWGKHRDFRSISVFGIGDCRVVDSFDRDVTFSTEQWRLFIAGDGRRSTTHQRVLF